MSHIFQIQPVFTETDTYEVWKNLALGNGLFFEVFDNKTNREVLGKNLQDIRQNKLVNSVHAAFIDVNPVSNNPAILEVSRKQLMDSCNFANELGAKNIVIHGSCFPFLRDAYYECWVKASSEYFDSLSKETGLNIFVENSQDLDPTPLEGLMQARHNSNVNICFDIGHANISRENCALWFDSLSNWIKYIHLSDNSGFFDSHLILGNGTVDWGRINEAVKHLSDNLIFTFEVGGIPEIKKSISFLKNNGFLGFGDTKSSCSTYKTPKTVILDSRISSIGSSIVRDMSDGVMAIGFDGLIWYINDAACNLLETKRSCIEKRNFASCFFEHEENDKFNQVILDAMYDHETEHSAIVDFYTGKATKKLHIKTSFSKEDGKKLGIVVVFSDVSEILNLKNSLKSMDEINSKLNSKNQLLGKTFGRYLSDEIVNKILESPDGMKMGGEKKHLTILMSDLRGFTYLSERLEAKDLMKMLNHYLGEMTRLISSFHGTIIEFIGDAILAIFGAPIERDSHPSDAVAAAIAMQSKMDETNKWNKENGFPTLMMGVGICTGDVIVGNIGSERHAKYGVVGSNVNLCGRIESFCTGGQIYISPQTYKECKADLGVEETIKVQAKGVKEPIAIYRINSIGAPYNLTHTTRENLPETLEKPLDINFKVLDGKVVNSEIFKGIATAISETNIVIKTEKKLERFDNVQLLMPKEILGKVTTVLPDSSFLITFTV